MAGSEALLAYGYTVIVAWGAAGELGRRAMQQGGRSATRVPPSLWLDVDEARALATELLIVAIEKFRTRSLPTWRAAGGASLDALSLHAAVIQRVVEQTSRLRFPVDVTTPFEQRVVDFVRRESVLLEAITPFRRAANLHAPFTSKVRQSLHTASTDLRHKVAATFEPELSQFAEADRRTVLDGLVGALSWPSWNTLRTENHRSIEEAGAVVRRLVQVLLGSGSTR